MDIFGALTGSVGNIATGLPNLIMDNFIPIAAVLGIGALVTSQGVDAVGNLTGFADHALGSFLHMIDGTPQIEPPLETQTETVNLEETHGENFASSELTKDEQKQVINNILMKAGITDTPDTILNKAAEQLHLTDEQKESARGIVNDVYNEMKGNIGRALTDRQGLVNDALDLADQKGLFEIIGSSPSISDRTVSQETAQASVPNTDTQTQEKPKQKEKNVEVEQER